MKTKSNSNLIARALVGVVACLLLSNAGFAQVFTPAGDRDQQFNELAQSSSNAQSHLLLVRKIVKLTKPTVVHIEAKKRSKQASSSVSSDSTQRSVVEEAGSGIVLKYNNTTFVVTNYHVVEDSEIHQIRIEADGKVFYPSRVEHDASTDLSVLITDRSDLVAARVGDSSAVEIGDFVVAIGSPFGLSHSVSYGIISAKGRRDLELGPQGVRFQDFFQTDASINPGNSGGPLINLRGEVIGINTAIASNSGGSDGIGFSIPIQMVMRIAKDLIDHKQVIRGFLGVSLDARYTHDKGRTIGLDLNYGTRVSGVTPNSPAEVADFQVGDVILEFGGKRIVSDSHLVTEVSLRRVGDDIPVKVFRAGKFKTIQVKIDNRRDFRGRN